MPGMRSVLPNRGNDSQACVPFSCRFRELWLDLSIEIPNLEGIQVTSANIRVRKRIQIGLDEATGTPVFKVVRKYLGSLKERRATREQRRASKKERYGVPEMHCNTNIALLHYCTSGYAIMQYAILGAIMP